MSEPFDLEGKVKFNKNYYRRMGRKEEQERIIKLLTESDSVCNEWAIALIKGENTDKAKVHTSADNALSDIKGENK